METFEIVVDRVVFITEALDEDHAVLLVEQELGDFAWSWDGVHVN
jgi:hypothetical protein